MMKFNALLIIWWFAALLSAADDETHFKNSGYFFAILDGKMFEMRDNDKYRAELINRTATLENKSGGPTQVIAALNFYGNTFPNADGKAFDEMITMEYRFDEGALGAPKDFKIELHYDFKDYYQLPGSTKFNVSNIEWSPDRTSFLMSAEYDCKLRKWGFPAESQPVVRLKGRMVNIHVTVPPWVHIKNPRQTAGND